jgi:hypothetical protein
MLFAWFDALGKRHFSLPACCANSLSFFNDVSPKTRPTIVILKPNNNTDLFGLEKPRGFKFNLLVASYTINVPYLF